MANDLHNTVAMNRTALLLLAVLMADCARSGKPAGVQADPNFRTIDNTDMRRTAMDPPPTLNDMTPVPKPKGVPGATVAQATDTAPLANVPFAPAIAMDPVDGSKIPITVNTPTYELKGHVYYFGSEANRKTFETDPTNYLRGAFSHL
ncbi:MAG: hypothetical protein JWO56_357 [Acidobacteria bacterium]|nr:hypothetical protein [Acidobacteriota bacterium]